MIWIITEYTILLFGRPMGFSFENKSKYHWVTMCYLTLIYSNYLSERICRLNLSINIINDFIMFCRRYHVLGEFGCKVTKLFNMSCKIQSWNYDCIKLTNLSWFIMNGLKLRLLSILQWQCKNSVVVVYCPPFHAVWQNHNMVEFQHCSVTNPNLGSVAYFYVDISRPPCPPLLPL